MKARLRAAFEKRLVLVLMASKIIAQISRWQCSRFLPLSWVGKLLALPLFYIMKDDFYKLFIFSEKSKLIKQSNKAGFWVSLFPESYLLKAIADKTCSAENYHQFLKKANMNNDMQFVWAQRFMGVGRLDLARAAFHELTALSSNKITIEMRLQALRHMGIVCFLLGENTEANHYWRLAGELRRVLFLPSTPKKYRILGPSWFIAIGHIAMLDYYLKFRQLHAEPGARIVAQWPTFQTPGRELINKISKRSNSNIPGHQLMSRFAQCGIEIIKPEMLESDYNKWAKKNMKPLWIDLTAAEKAAMVDDFWEFDFSDGEVLGYAHAASRIQKEWEKAGFQALFTLSDEEKEWIAAYLHSLGLPKNAWYVCLHVRESGFHQEWNSMYPSMRDARIEDYRLAIEAIVNAGGWVLRMGDPSMKPLQPMPHVVDYAHSNLKTPMADVLLAAGCRYFLGTNSGYATICTIYNVPCALSNWVPLGWPLWPKQDLMIPKLFRDKQSGHCLKISQIFERHLAFIQNENELPKGIEVVSNTPEELKALALEMLLQCQINQEQRDMHTGAPAAIQNYYEQLAKQAGAFTGSRLARSFVEKHLELFSSPESEALESTKTTRGKISPWQEPLKDNMTATLN